jgi:hypothetical protein
MKYLWIFLLAAIISYGPTVFAQPQQSENFRIAKSVLDAGGGASTSTNFRLTSAFGQPTPIGVSSSTSFVLSAGFLSPQFAASPLSPIQDLVIKRAPASNNVQLDWSAISGATLYTVYRDVTPTFTPSPSNQIGTSATNSFTDVNAVNLPAIKYFYNVTSSPGSSPGLARAPENSPLARQASDPGKRSSAPANPGARQISTKR